MQRSADDMYAVNPAYLTTDFDMSVLVAMCRGVRRMYGAPALRGIVGQEILPGTQTVPANASDAEWAQFIAASYAVRAVATRFSRTRLADWCIAGLSSNRHSGHASP
jgi:hypothetical protein